jgi:hypothetical protein
LGKGLEILTFWGVTAGAGGKTCPEYVPAFGYDLSTFPRARGFAVWHGRQIRASKSARVSLAVRDEQCIAVSHFLAARVLRAKHGRLARSSARQYPRPHRFASFKASFEPPIR